MTQKRGYPDRRGMGAESDPTMESYVPSETYKTQQMAMARKMIAAGLKPEHVATMFFIPLELLTSEESKKS